MVFVYAACVLLCFIGAGYNFKGFNKEGSLERRTTDSIKGLFVLLVFLSHFRQYYTYTQKFDVWGGMVSGELSQLIVVMFMFYSGYGVLEAVKRKGSGYVRSFPKNRVLKTLVHFDIAVLLFLIVDIILGRIGTEFSITDVLLAFVGWTSIGNSNWYIFAVLILYITTFIGFAVFGKNNVLAVVLSTVLIGVYAVVISKFQSYWWYDTVFCYALGMWFSLFKNRVLGFVTKNNAVWLLLTAAVIAGARVCHVVGFAVIGWRIAMALLFALAFVFVSLKITVHNKVLAWLGQHTFEVYILMRMPMLLFGRWGLGKINVYLYFFACLAATLLMSFAFGKLTGALDKKLFAKKQTA